MGLLSEQWRKRAEELNSALKPLLESAGVVPALVQAVKAAVLPELLLNMADMLDVLEAMPESDDKLQSARARVERNNRIRMAAATGDWHVIDSIIDDAVNTARAENS